LNHRISWFFRIIWRITKRNMHGDLVKAQSVTCLSDRSNNKLP
jgi:hypothetical protein